MKNSILILSLIACLFISSNSNSQLVTVDGRALLENQTNNTGIRIIFNRIAPDVSYDTVFTDVAGLYSKDIFTGIYNIQFSKNNFYSQELRDVIVYSNKTLNDVTLKISGLSGRISGVLKKGDYVVGDSLFMLKGDTLIIEAGARLFFKKNTGLTISGGCFKAIGAENDSIFFTRFLEPDDNADSIFWKGIQFKYNSVDSNSKFKYCHFSYCNHPALNVELCDPVIESILVSDCYNRGGIQIHGGKAKLINSRFINCVLNDTSRIQGMPYISHVYFVNAGQVKVENIEISGIKSKYVAAIGFFDSAPIINNALITNNTGEAIEIYNSNAKLNNCTIVNNYIVISKGPGNIFMNNCIIANNNYMGGISDGIVRVVNSCIYKDTSCTGWDKWFCVNVTKNKNGDSCDVYGNIQLDPQFIDPENKDYRILPTSPCIDAGVNDSVVSKLEFDGNKRIWDGNLDGDSLVDMGCYEFGAPPLNNILIDEDFERDYINWKITSNGDESPKWILHHSPSVAHSGEFCLMLEGSAITSGSSLFTDFVNLPIVENIKLKFWIKIKPLNILEKQKDKTATGSGYFSVVLSKYGEENINELVFEKGDINDEWTEYAVDLNKYAGKRVRLVFYGSPTGGKNMFLDDIILNINEKPTDIIFESENLNSPYDYLMHPNPASDYIEITGLNQRFKSLVQDLEINIYNSLGELVMTVPAGFETTPRRQIDISKLPAGVFYVKLGENVMMFLKE